MHETEATMITSRRSKSERVALMRSLSSSSLDGCFLFNVHVGGRHVGFGLVEVVVAYKIFDGIVRKKLLNS